MLDEVYAEKGGKVTSRAGEAVEPPQPQASAPIGKQNDFYQAIISFLYFRSTQLVGSSLRCMH